MVRLILGILLCIWSFLMILVSINLKEPLDAAGAFAIMIFLIPGVLLIIYGRRARKIKREKKATQVTDTKILEEKISSPPIDAINQSEKILDKAQFENKFNNSDKKLGFFEGEIPLDFKNRVLSKAKIDSTEKVILFIDQGVFNRGVAGLVFTDKGIYKYGRISCKFYPYSVVKTLSLQNVDKPYCNISVLLSSNVRYPLDQIASAEHVAFFKLLTPYIANIEVDKPDFEIRIDMVKKGCFFARIDRWDEKIRDALCYLVFPEEKAKIKIKEDGIDFGKLQIF